MHKSRLGTLIIDCQTQDLDAAAAFWGQALGCPAQPPHDPNDPNYRRLETAGNQPVMLVQQVEHPSRVHLDIETDDIEAEVRRLEQLARRLSRWRQRMAVEMSQGEPCRRRG